ncbi:MAG TPA: hypothetical protein VJS30_01070, partial [Paraburkholderia sp.]|nr:hypothetical protein [Paraburkholderia sp.]
SARLARAVLVVLYSPASLALLGGLGSSHHDIRGNYLFNLFTGCCTSPNEPTRLGGGRSAVVLARRRAADVRGAHTLVLIAVIAEAWLVISLFSVGTPLRVPRNNINSEFSLQSIESGRCPIAEFQVRGGL